LRLFLNGNRVWFYGLLFSLTACTGVTVKESEPANEAAFEARTANLVVITQWGLSGKISLDDGNEGGSGKLRWDVEPGRSQLDFHGAFGRGAWQLSVGPEGALLRMADGTEQLTAGVDELIREHIGWPVPLDALKWWVRGLAAPGLVEDKQIDANGLLLSLQQFGWSVNFNRYDAAGEFELPVRIEATRNNHRVKLAISRWRVHADNDL